MKTTGWRRVASAIWRAPTDPQVYGILEVDATPVLAFAQRAREAGHPVTPTHFVGRALALGLRAVPELNVLIRRGRTIPRKSVDVFFITAVGGGHDLSGVKIPSADRVPLVDLARQLSTDARKLKAGEDRVFQRTKRSTDSLPFFILRPLLRLLAFLAGELGWSLKPLGLVKYPFGSAMITSIGMFGLPLAFAPIAWMYKVPILVLVGELERKPLAVGDGIEVRPVLPITASIDHRYVDGSEIAKLTKVIKAYFAAPEQFEPAPG